jgi:hypothetical protein
MYGRRNKPSRRSQLGFLFIGRDKAMLDGRWNPRSLFRAGEQGAWYDPSDLSSMYQESTGVTPAVVGQPVGLLLDKRYGLVRGAELVTNGTFDADVSGWTVGTGLTATWSAGVAQLARNGAINSAAAFARSFTTTVGRLYTLTFTSTNASVAYSVHTGPVIAPITAGLGTFTVSFIAVATSHTVNFWPSSDLTTCYLDNISVREIPGNHAIQATAASRPTLLQDASGLYYLSFDGVDDSLATSAIDFTATDKMTVWAGAYKASDAVIGMLAELSAGAEANAGAWRITAPNSTLNGFMFNSGGSPASADGEAANTTSAAPLAAVLAAQGSISSPLASLRVNGGAAITSAASQGTGNYGNYPLYIGRRGAATLPFNGRIYSLIVRGAASSASQIAAAERYVAARTGVSL